MPAFLASVLSAAEAQLAAAAGADIIDAKDPAAGALGALETATVRAIRAATPKNTPVSATIGDIPCEPGPVVAAIAERARLGVSFVKFGLFPDGERLATIQALAPIAASGVRIIGMLLADRDPDLTLLQHMAIARFHGAMIDTADKSGRSLLDVMTVNELRAYIANASRCGLLAGVAGSLRREHIPALLTLSPDVIGFRGALCAGGRSGAIDWDAMLAIRSAIPRDEAWAALGVSEAPRASCAV